MTRYAIALGSNLGDRVGYLRAAIEELGALGVVAAVSGLYETAPIGGPEQGPFLNAVVIVESELGPMEMLGRLQQIESEHGREREVRWGPRTLDLDIVTMDPGSVDSSALQVPHPRAAERRFVVEPLYRLWPDAILGAGRTAGSVRHEVAEQEVDLLASRWLDETRRPGRYWVAAQVVILLAIAAALIIDGSLPGTNGDPLPGGWRVVGGALIALGGLVAVAAARALGRALTALPEPVRGATLVETGPYRYVRHPIYGAVVVAMLGASLLMASRIAFMLTLGLLGFFWAKSSYEERQLRIAYAGYRAYMGRVRHRIIPFTV